MEQFNNKILFVSREKKDGQPSPIINAQLNSMSSVNVETYLIQGRGWMAYIRGIKRLRVYIQKNNIDIVHAHYSLSGYTAALSTQKPVICSLMGSDLQAKGFKKIILKLFCNYLWNGVIVKSLEMKELLGNINAWIVPNGVSFTVFKPIQTDLAKDKVGFNKTLKTIVFVANPSRDEKNYSLAQEACSLIGSGDVRLHVVFNVDHSKIPLYLSAADVLLLTSKWEGSPNVIKEAMACNCPIVSTDVGDVKELVGDTEGCYITTFDPEDVAEKLEKALDFGKRTNGREKIQHLDEKIIADRLIEVYKSILKDAG